MRARIDAALTESGIKTHRVIIVLIVLFASLCAPSHAKQDHQIIKLWYRNYDSAQTLGLLHLALSKTTHEYGSYEIVRGQKLSQRRALAALIRNQTYLLDVINAVVDDEREAALHPVRVVSDEGLIGYRVCLIHRDDLPRFENIRSHAATQTSPAVVLSLAKALTGPTHVFFVRTRSRS